MKKKLCILLFTFITITTFGQVIPKGTRFIGGDLSFNYRAAKTDGAVYNNVVQFGISPTYTKFIKDNFSVTYMLGYDLQTNGNRTSSGGTDLYTVGQHTISVGVYLRNYKMISEKFGISVNYGGNIGYSFHTISVETLKGSTTNGIAFNFSAGPGAIYMLNEKFAIEGTASLFNFNVGYSWLNKSNLVTVGTGISASPGLGIGFRYFLK